MHVHLGDKPIELYGTRIKKGDSIAGNFRLPAAYNTKAPFHTKLVRKGLVILSTLPNIKSNACTTQVLDLEKEINLRKLDAKIYHVACDCPEHWEEVRVLHPFLKAKGFTLQLASEDDSEEFKQSLGVGVLGSKRIVHGLFAFLDGKLISSYIPRQQYGVPNIKRFLDGIVL
jgi:peroxiredoxin